MYLYMKKAQESRSQPAGALQLISKFEVTFDPNGAGPAVNGYFPSETVKGEVTLTYGTPSGTQPKALKLQLIGAERVSWYDEKEHSSKRILTIDVSTKAVPGIEGKFNFEVTLPSKLPQTFSAKQGSISYWIEPIFGDSILTALSNRTRHEGKMNTKQRNEFLKKYRKPIKILAHFDLSAYPSFHYPISVMRDNSGLFSSKNLIEVILALPKLGYVPNESIEFKMHIINGSDKAITSSTITLVQEAKFCAGPINTQEAKKLFKTSGPELTLRSCQEWNGSIKIPSKVSPISVRCSFITVDYYLKASVTSTGFMETVEAKVPIVIGTVSTTGVDTNVELGTTKPSIPLSSSLESIVSQVTYCSHGYMDRNCSEAADRLPNYATLAAAMPSKLKLDDDWDRMSFSSLPAYNEVVSGAVGSSTTKRPC